MKSFVICICITAVIFCAAMFNNGAVSAHADKMEGLLDRVCAEPGEQSAAELLEEWGRAKIIFGATVGGEELRELGEAVTEVVCSVGGTRGELQRACAICRLRILEIAGAERVTIGQIF